MIDTQPCSGVTRGTSQCGRCYQTASQYCINAAYCCKPSSVVCLSVTVMSPAKTAEPMEMLFGLRTRVGHKEACVRWDPYLPMCKINFEAKGASHCNVYGLSSVVCAKTAEPIEMSLWVWTQVSPRKHTLDGVLVGATW